MQMQIGATSGGVGTAQVKQKAKSKNPFGDSSDDEPEFDAKKAAGTGYGGKSKFNAFLDDKEEDKEEDTFVPGKKTAQVAVAKPKPKLLESDEESDDGF